MSFANRIREFFAARAEHKAVADEMEFHIERETEHNIERGMSAREARRKAAQDFGSVEAFREAARDERTGTRFADFKASWLDWKLGGRMLLKYPGLSLIGGLTLAAAMGLGAGWFEFSWEMRDPRLPLPEGDRIVRVESWDAASGGVDARAVFDFLAWREQLTTIEQFGAYRDVERNLAAPDGRVLPMMVAEISPVAFTVTRVPPLLGRPLVAADAEPGAPDVIVIGHNLWQTRFNGDPSVIGRTVQLGRVKATVVGVMPEEYLFPVNHQLWSPLRLAQTQPRSGPAIRTFGRLREGVSRDNAQAELDAIGARIAAENPATHAQLRPRVLAYAHPGAYTGSSEGLAELFMINLFAWLVLAVAGANVATLMFARTALRESEIVVRNALGASRLRVMGQLFAESLVLSLVSAGVGLIGLIGFFRWAKTNIASDVEWPFWWDLSIGPATILYTGALAVFGAVMVGLLPALRATGPKVQQALRNIGGGGTHMQIGGVWSALIIFQVSLSVLGLPIAISASREALSEQRVRAQFEAGPYLTFRTAIGGDAPVDADPAADSLPVRMAATIAELERRIESEPGVAAFTYASALPGSYHPLVQLEVQRGEEKPAVIGTYNGTDQVRVSNVDIGFFDAFRIPLIAGRSFVHGDVAAANGVVIINQALAEDIGGNPIGVRVREVAEDEEAEPAPWREVIGVVRNIGLDPTDQGEADFMFTPAAVDKMQAPPAVVIRMNGDPAAFEPKLRAIAAQVAPDVRLNDVLPLADVIRRYDEPDMLASLTAVGVILLVLMLSAAGLFALMSVAVARRTREIGIRLAIGANPRAVLAALFKRAAAQVGAGIIVGNLLVVLTLSIVTQELALTIVAGPMVVASLIMAIVGLVACAVPARRALRVQPTEALKGAR
jgi:putative ABC transport system permease protein